LLGGIIAANQSIYSGSDVAAFTSSAAASGGTAPYTYTWQYSTTSSTAGSGSWTNIGSSNSETYDYGTLTTTTYFTRMVVDDASATAYSNVLTISVTTDDAESYWRFNYSWNDDQGNHNLTAKNSATFYNGSLCEGTYSADFNITQFNRAVTQNKVDLSSGGFTCSFSFRTTNSGSIRTLWTNQEYNGQKGIKVELDEVNKKIIVTTDNGSAEASANSANNAINTSGEWNHAAIRTYDLNGGNFAIFINGYLSMGDSTTQSGSGVNDTLCIGANRQQASHGTFYGRIDNFAIYKCALTDAQIATLAANKTNNYMASCGTEAPPSDYLGRRTWHPVPVLYHKYRNGTLIGYWKRHEAEIPPVEYGVYEDILNAQNALIPDDAVINDYVVELNYNRNWKDDHEFTYTYLSGSSLFGITSSGIVICETNNPAIGSYYVKYMITDRTGNFSDTARVDITVVDADNCIYYDPSNNTGLDAGTRDHPYWTVHSAWTSGKYYLFRRGTTMNISSYIAPNVNNITIGAYGVGSRPIIYNSVYYTTSIGTLHISGRTSVTVRDIHINNPAAIANLTTAGMCYNIVLDNCVFQGSATGTWNGLRLYSITGGAISNCEVYNILDDGIIFLNYNGAGTSGTSTVNRFFFENNYIHHVGNGYGSGYNGDCVDFSTGVNRFVHIRYNLADKTNQAYKHGLKYNGGISTYSPAYVDCESIIEYNRVECYRNDFTQGQNGISLYNARNVICRYNEVNYANMSIYTSPEAEDAYEGKNSKLHIYGNLLSCSYYAGIELSANCDSSEVYNNTIVWHSMGTTNSGRRGMRIEAGCERVKIKNNIFHAEAGYQIGPIYAASATFTEQYNLFAPDAAAFANDVTSKEGNPNFVEGEHSAWEIDESSPAYHAGTDVSITTDLWGDPFNDPPSIGYKEYDTTGGSYAVPDIYWLFNNSWADEGSGGYDLTTYNSPVFKTSIPDPVEGTYCADFKSATDSYAETTDPIDLSSGAVTFSFSVYNTADVGLSAIIFSNLGPHGLHCKMNGNSDRIVLEMYPDGGGMVEVTTLTGTVPENTWTHVGIRMYDGDGAYATLWLNGSKTTYDSTGVANCGIDNELRFSGTSASWLEGYLDNFQIYKRALSDAEMQLLYYNRGRSGE
jgi:hypothetical protein